MYRMTIWTQYTQVITKIVLFVTVNVINLNYVLSITSSLIKPANFTTITCFF